MSGLGDDAFEAAVFVDHDSHVHGDGLEPLERTQDGSLVGQHQRLADHRHDVQLLTVQELIEQVLLAHLSQHVVDLAAADQDAREVTVADFAPQRRFVVARVDPVDVRARRHHRAHRAVGEAEHSLDHLVLLAMDLPYLRSFGDEHADLLFRHAFVGMTRHTQRPQHSVVRDAQQPNQRPTQPGHGGDGPRDARSHLLRIAQREMLRHQLADDEREISDSDHRDRDAKRLGIGRDGGIPLQPIVKLLRDGRAGDGA